MIAHFLAIICIFWNSSIFSYGLAHDEETLKCKYGKLVHVSVIFRHGDRTPFCIYPRDPHKSYPWPDGLKQLLMTGKLRMYNLGKWFHKQYKDLLNTIQSHTQIMVESSDTDSTIMSAQYFMASFYTPNMMQRISKNIPWQAIPIHTSSITEQNYIWNLAPCPRELYYVKKLYRTKEMKKKYDEHKNTFDFLQRHTGLIFSRNDLFSAALRLACIFNTLEIQESNNLKLPSWTKKVYPRPLEKLMKLFIERLMNYSNITRYKAGPIMKSIVVDLILAKNLTNNSRKIFHFYSGHDTTIMAVMSALGIYNGVIPPYGCALILELRNKGKDNFIVARYKNPQNSTIQLLNIPKCGKFCTVEKFTKMVRPLMIKNWKLECRMKNRSHEASNGNVSI